MDLLLALAFGALPTAAAQTLAEHTALLDAWPLPALAAAIAVAAAGSGTVAWRAGRIAPTVGQLWADTSRTIRGLTIRITEVSPGRVRAVIAAPPRSALHDTTGREMELAAGRSGPRGFRLVGTQRSAQR